MNKIIAEKTPSIIMDHMYFDKIMFKRLRILSPADFDPPELKVSNEIYRVQDYTYLVYLSLGALKKDEYEACVTVAGMFTIDKDQDIPKEGIEDLINELAPRTLFPYLREKLTTLTCQPYTAPYVIPPVNILSAIDRIPLSRILDVSDFDTRFTDLYVLNHIPRNMKKEDLELRDNIITMIYSTRKDMKISKTGNIALSKKDYRTLAEDIRDEYYRVKDPSHRETGDPYDATYMTRIMQSLKIPVVFTKDMINDLLNKVSDESQNDVQYLVLVNGGEIYN